VNNILKRLALLVLLLGAVVGAGTISFVSLEGLSPFDALYLTFLTISTLGYSNITPTTSAGKVVAMVLLVFGFGIFSALVVTTTQAILERKENQRRIHQINTLVSLYFSDVGNELLSIFCKNDPFISGSWVAFSESGSGQDADFHKLIDKLNEHTYTLEITYPQIPSLKSFLDSRGDLLLRLLENQHILEHGPFMNLLRSIFHLRHELTTEADKNASKHPTLEHINSDAVKVYRYSCALWVEHMQYQRKNYPTLFRTSLESNPFYRTKKMTRPTDQPANLT
jgi:voltage-gated potassium channel